jgi:hypothetical protein
MRCYDSKEGGFFNGMNAAVSFLLQPLPQRREQYCVQEELAGRKSDRNVPQTQALPDTKYPK